MYEVFINFRGEDVRYGFLSHIRKTLVEKRIHTFVDDQLIKGEEISSSLQNIIEGSTISVVIFSENYAESPYCLEELVKILECKKTMGKIVIPVFYKVKPDDIQELTGSFGRAVSQHKQDIKLSHKVDNWRQALLETSFFSGFDSHKYPSECSLIEDIIKAIQEKLYHLSVNDCSYNDGLVGMHSRVSNVKVLLCNEDVRVVGIWGPGGIGKTTIAQTLFSQICGEFESYCFVSNVTEKYENCPDAIHSEILSTLLGKDGFHMANFVLASSFIRRTLARMKVLIVLDDVSDFDQVKSIVATHVHYGSGSRIIVTSRDKQVLINVDAKIYMVEELNECEALQLFCLHAFKQNVPQEDYMVLSKMAVNYAGGLPLALQVLGCDLCSRSVKEWEDELENLKGTADRKVHKILRRSYDELFNDVKEIFLDIACFFKGKDREYVASIVVKDCLEDSPKISGSKIGISRLVDKCLISISSKNCIEMHDLIQQMGKQIECEEQKLKRRRRVWKPKEVIRLLTNEQGSEATKGLSLDVSKIKDISLSPRAFKKMDNLKYLIFYDPLHTGEIRVYLPEGLEYLSEELRCLSWYGYPIKSLPKSFCAENLVELDMPFSELEKLWDGVQNLANLKSIDLYNSKLIKLPDLSRALNLEVLKLVGNERLVELPLSLKYLTKLTDLHLNGCKSLSHLPTCLHLINLKSLGLFNCSKLTIFPKIPCYESHHANEITEMTCDFQLHTLDLGCCSRLNCLPDSICNLTCLKELIIYRCTNLFELPENLGNLKFLNWLIATESGLNKLPDSLCNLKYLQRLELGGCVNLRELPQNLGNLKSLKELTASRTGIKELPSSINELRELRTLKLEGCKGLKLPMWTANSGLQVSMTGNFPLLEDVNLSFCEISEFPSSLCSVTSLKRLDVRGNNFESIPEYINQLSNLQVLRLRDCKRLKHLPDMIGLFNLNLMYMIDFLNCIDLDDC